jgi:hypothetical protein
MDPNFEKNVFINCPFDPDYIKLLRPLIFTIICLGFIPRIASERMDSGEIRFDKIKELIESSKFSIHDLSANKAKKKNEYYRLNMPFEIGLDLGCRLYHENAAFRDKKSLILEGERYSHQKALSDLSNSDVKCHKNDEEELVLEVRNWFSELGFDKVKSGSKIWDMFNEFMTVFHEQRTTDGFREKDIYRLPVPEFIRYVNDWLN